MIQEVKKRIELIRTGKVPHGYIKENNTIRCDEWTYDCVSNSMEIRNNLRIPINEEERKCIQGNYPYYGPTKVQDYLDRYTVEGEHVLIGEDGDHFLKYKEKEMTLLVDGKFNVNNHAHILRGTNKCITKWFYYYFQHRDIFDSLTRQGAGRYKLSKDSLQKMRIAIPPIQEQHKIVDIFSTWDKAIELKEKLIEQRKNQKRGLMEKLLTGEVRLPGFNGEWRETRLDKIAKVSIGLVTTMTSNYVGDGVLMIRNSDILENEFKQDGLVNLDKDFVEKNKSRTLRVGDIVTVHTGDVGMSAVINEKFDGAVGFATLNTRVRDKARWNSKFISHFFNSEKYKTWALRMSTGDGRNNFNLKDFKNSMVPDISIEEQNEITKILDNEVQGITLLEQELSALKLQKKGLMQLLLTGIVRVNT